MYNVYASKFKTLSAFDRKYVIIYNIVQLCYAFFYDWFIECDYILFFFFF